ncbi:hypothetical protein EJ06DRAFT_529413 [Trichodelitschia bisporula]|uniref:SnoaL-like domain-containing protein n=1 Tax=Trichodelitschia bisporula TaxID=703511 RepID=A0A6G1HZ17_9PEZI|nr:hypothetical protein EJ06DRAFT_529413 [Trichodelitschia bisporula]
MTVPTTPAFIVPNATDWKDLIAHPVMAWMQEYTRRFDKGEIQGLDFNTFCTSDLKYEKMDGTIWTGGERAWDAVLETYAPFKETKHAPSGTVVVWETEKGWEMMGQVTLWGDLKLPGDSLVVDSEGRAWDTAGPAMFHFKYVKDPEAPHGGLRISECKVCADRAGTYQEMMKRGMV